jgi:anti-anti-sigma factor
VQTPGVDVDGQRSSDQTQFDAAERSDGLPRFRCETIQGGLGGSWVEVAGDLDLRSAPRLEREVLKASATARLVVLDLRDLHLIDCTGVHVVVRASGRLRREGRRLIVLRGPAQVDRVFALTATDGELEFLDVDAAAPAVRKLLRLATDPDDRSLHLVEASGSPSDRP